MGARGMTYKGRIGATRIPARQPGTKKHGAACRTPWSPALRHSRRGPTLTVVSPAGVWMRHSGPVPARAETRACADPPFLPMVSSQASPHLGAARQRRGHPPEARLGRRARLSSALRRSVVGLLLRLLLAGDAVGHVIPDQVLAAVVVGHRICSTRPARRVARRTCGAGPGSRSDLEAGHVATVPGFGQ
jgi:hypothetical protein